jgi:hypothetical protein
LSHTLNDFYVKLKVATSGQPLTARLFPQICSYPSSAANVRFRYISKLAVKSPEKAVFKAETEGDKRLIMIKFTQQYCEDAHRVLAEKRLTKI